MEFRRVRRYVFQFLLGRCFCFCFGFLGFFQNGGMIDYYHYCFLGGIKQIFFFIYSNYNKIKWKYIVEISFLCFALLVFCHPDFFITHYRYSESRNGNAFPLFSFAVARWRCWLFLAETMIYPDLRPEFPLFLLLLLLLLLLLFVPLLLLFCRHELKKNC